MEEGAGPGRHGVAEQAAGEARNCPPRITAAATYAHPEMPIAAGSRVTATMRNEYRRIWRVASWSPRTTGSIGTPAAW